MREWFDLFDDMAADVGENKKLNPIISELFQRGKHSTSHLFLYHNLI